ncbi:MAG: Transglutaminase-like protein [Microgenomates group bacterium LiPW_16]|nr:MAG: Transglutaminase-like protein [Microgenomates group bacterium LiPW_16]
MKNLFKNFFVIFLFIFFIFNLWSSSAYAASEFSNAYDVTYDVRENGDTIVTQNVHLTNLTTNYYASEYSLTFGTEKIEEVSAWDGAGLLKVDVKKGTDLTQIHVVFNERVVGQGKTLNWTLRYQSD